MKKEERSELIEYWEYGEGSVLKENVCEERGNCEECGKYRNLEYVLYFEKGEGFVTICGVCVRKIGREGIEGVKERNKERIERENIREVRKGRWNYEAKGRREKEEGRIWREENGKIVYRCKCGEDFEGIENYYNHKQRCEKWKEERVRGVGGGVY